ncbi:putative protein N(5)-glutamine methyltransferase [Streptomyces sp. NPDC005963]|uniref:putative protein N(5)-glutamine methyltransferase n=1 Tax=Streptomyces sp. NPDC005963 TaxID=3156721 RepID=UPI0033EEE830
MSLPSFPPLDDIVRVLRTAGCVFAEDEADLLLSAASGPAALATMVEHRTSGRPLEHIVGWAAFAGLRIRVDPGVFVPRRRTEFLVQQAVSLTRTHSVVVDLCCGSGALGAALAHSVHPIELHACDIDPRAVRCARANIRAGEGQVNEGQVYEGDLYAPLPARLRGRVGVLLANVPYVPTDEIALLPVEARVHEARIALDGGADGLDVLRRVAARAERWLAPGGSMLFETSRGQLPTALDIVARGGLEPRTAVDEDRWATVVIGTKQG